MDRFLERAVAERDIECADNPRTRNVGCGRIARWAAAGECRRSHRQWDAGCAERSGRTSDTVHAESHVELLGMAGNGNSGCGKLYGCGRRNDSDRIVDIA